MNQLDRRPQPSASAQTAPGAGNTGMRGLITISSDTSITGEIRNCQRLEVSGYLEGTINCQELLVHPDGRVFGTLKIGSCEVHGQVQGTVFAKDLVAVTKTGKISGDLTYGRLVVQPGGDISAEVRNVPPAIMGDLSISVKRGKSVLITTLDLNAVDPDDPADKLVYTVSNEQGGFVAYASAPDAKITNFTQAELQAGNIIFKHDGGAGDKASFAVVVKDASGASSGSPQTVNAAVI